LYKNYRESGNKKIMTLSNEEFTRRFVQHILPPRFVRICHYRILSGPWKRGKLQALQIQHNPIAPRVCPAFARQTPLMSCSNISKADVCKKLLRARAPARRGLGSTG
jgi:hypothetical protein